MTRQQIVRYAVAGLGLLLASAMWRVMNTLPEPRQRADQLMLLVLLCVLMLPPGLLLGWGFREPASWARRFDVVAFVVFALIPLLIGLVPAIAFVTQNYGKFMVYSDRVMLGDVWTLLVPNLGLLAGMGIIHSFPTQANQGDA